MATISQNQSLADQQIIFFKFLRYLGRCPLLFKSCNKTGIIKYEYRPWKSLEFYWSMVSTFLSSTIIFMGFLLYGRLGFRTIIAPEL